MKNSLEFVGLIRLLDQCEGATVVHAACSEFSFDMQLSISDAKTRLLVFYVAEASNFQLNVYAKYHPAELGVIANPDEALVYSFYVKNSDDIQDQICWLGSHFAWAMCKAGLIDFDEEARYCEIFGAEPKTR